jgi:Tol biopolymer transport system component
VFESSVSGDMDIYRIPAEGGKPTRLTNRVGTDSVPSWSHDGQWIYFTSRRSGEPEIWKVAADGGSPVRVTREGGSTPFESPGGEYLYYARDLGIWRVPRDGGEEREVTPSIWSAYCFSVRAEGIYFIDSEGLSVRLWNSETGDITRVGEVETPGEFGLDVSPDGRWILYPQIAERKADLMLVEGFR